MGADSFTFKANDGQLDSNVATVSISVTNQAPTASNFGTVSAKQGETAIVAFAANASDADSDPLNFVIVQQPAGGFVYFDYPSNYVFLAAANYVGADSFTYKATDGALDSNVATVTIEVQDEPLNVPTSVPTLSVDEGTPLNQALLTTFTDPNPAVEAGDFFVSVAWGDGQVDETGLPGSPITVSAVAGSPGTFAVYGSHLYYEVGEYTYQVTVTYQMTIVVAIGVVTVNQLPITVSSLSDLSATAGSQLTDAVVARFSHGNPIVDVHWADVDWGDGTSALATIETGQPGEYAVKGTHTYAYPGTYYVHLNVHDGVAYSKVAQITVNVGALPPTAVAKTYSDVITDTVFTGTGLLENATDPLNYPLSAEIAQLPGHGAVWLVDTDIFQYAPDPGYVGTDTFQIVASNGYATSDPVVITLVVSAPSTAAAQPADFIVHANTTFFRPAQNGLLAGANDRTVGLVQGVAHGMLAIDSDGSFTYTPDSGFLGTDQFTYRVFNGSFGGTPITAILAVTDQAPSGSADTYEVHGGSTFWPGGQTLVANDTDADGDQLSVHLVTGASHGRLTLNPDGTFTYAPQPGFVGADTFVYRAFDGASLSDPVTATIQVTNHAPTAMADAYELIAGREFSAGAWSGQPSLIANDTDEDFDTLLVSMLTGPSHGTFTLQQDGSITYVPFAGFVGVDSFTYRAFDGMAFSAAASVALEVVAATPFAQVDVYQAQSGAAFHVGPTWNIPGLLANDSEPDGSALTVTLFASPAHGALTLQPDGTFDYVPDAVFAGIDTFFYRAFNGYVFSDPALVTINVGNIAPFAAPLDYFVSAGAVLSATAGTGMAGGIGGVLDWAGDPQGLSITVNLVSGPSHGAFTIGFDGSFTYAPNPGFAGTDSFVFQAFNGVSLSLPASVTIHVTGEPPNPAPVPNVPLSILLPPAPSPDVYMVRGGSTFGVAAIGASGGINQTVAEISSGASASPAGTVYGVLENDYDPDGHALKAVLLTPAAHGTLVFNTDGTFAYTPLPGFVGLDSFSYAATNGFSSESTTVTLAVTGVVPVAREDAYTVFAGQTLSGAGTLSNPSVLANDVNADSGPLMAVIESGPAYGALILNSDGSFQYTPFGGFVGEDSLTYRDRNPRSIGAPNIVHITVLSPAVSTAPSSYAVHSGGTLSADVADGVLQSRKAIPAPGVTSVPTNAFIIPTSARLVEAPSLGTILLNSNGSFSYTPFADYIGVDSFRFVVQTATSASEQVEVQIVVTNTAPVGYADAFSVRAGSSLTGNVRTNDHDPDIDLVLIRLGQSVEHGVLLLNSDGSFTYTPAVGYVGSDSFAYQVGDGSSWSDPVTVPLTVTSTNPVATPDFHMAAHQGSNRLVASADGQGVLKNDKDPEPNTMLRAQLLTGPARGRLIFNSNGTFTYTANAGYLGEDSFTYRAATTTGVSSATTVKLRMANVDPVATNQYFLFAAQEWEKDKSPEEQKPDLVGNLFTPASPELDRPVFDVDGDFLNFTRVASVSNGYLWLDPGGTFRYKLEEDSEATGDTFSFYVTDGFGHSQTVEVRLFRDKIQPITAPGRFDFNAALASTLFTTAQSMQAVGQPTLAQLHSAATSAEGFVNNVLTGNYPEEVTGLTAVLATGAAFGSLTLNANGDFVYVPNKGYVGTDTFTYRVKDSEGTLGEPATVTLEVKGSTPTAVNDAYTVSLFGSVNGQVLDNDTSPGGGMVSAELRSNVAQGTLSFTNAGTFTYFANRGFVGTDSFTYVARTDTGVSNVATVTITITQANGAAGNGPISMQGAQMASPLGTAALASNLTVNVIHDQLYIRLPDQGVAGNAFADLEHPFTVWLDGPTTQHGVLGLFPSGAFLYRPEAGYVGPDSFRYVASNGKFGTVNISVTNRASTVQSHTYATAAGVGLNLGVDKGLLDGASDPDGDPLTAELVSDMGPLHGTVTLSSNGAMVYTPTAGFVGIDYFGYRARDNANSTTNVSGPQLAVVHILDAYPRAEADKYSVGQGQQLVINGSDGVTANDSDPDRELLRANPIQQPAHGTLELKPSGAFVYTPNADFVGTDGFLYQITDGIFVSAIRAVTLEVTAKPPLAGDDKFQLLHDTVLTVSPVNGILANDLSGNGETLVITLDTSPLHGALSLNPNGSFQHAPDAGFVGTDQFTYHVYDGQRLSHVATVTFEVTNKAPMTFGTGTLGTVTQSVALGSAAFSVVHDSKLIVSRWQGLLSTASDEDYDNLTVSQVWQSLHGEVAWEPSGAFIYTPDPGFVGTDVFTYQITDGVGASSIRAVTIVVTGDAVPRSGNDTYETAAGTPLVVSAPTGILANDWADDERPLTPVVLNSPRHGTLSMNPGGSFVYQPAAGFVGTDVFTYRADDGAPLGDPATVTIQVKNAAPAVGDTSFTLDHDTPLAVPAWRGISGTDADSDALTAFVVPDGGLVHHGQLTVYSNGGVSYRPDPGFAGTDMFLVQVTDGYTGSALAAVYFHVTDQAPVVPASSYSVAQGTLLSVPSLMGVTSQATDADGDLVEAMLAANPATGVLTLFAAGGFNYVAELEFAGADSFWVRATDGVRVSKAALVSLDVTAGGITTTDRTYRYTPYQTLQISAPQGVLANLSSASGQPLTAILLSAPVHGALFFDGNGSFSYVPSPNWTGGDTFTYEITDGVNTVGPLLVRLAPAGMPAVDDFYSFQHDLVASVGVDAGLLHDDFPAFANPVAELRNPPAHGMVAIAANGSFVYTPNAGYVGSDAFSYVLRDPVTNAVSNTATVHLAITNIAPPATDHSLSGLTNGTLTGWWWNGGQGNPVDADGDLLTATRASAPSHGTVVLLASGAWHYQPDISFTGVDSFEVSVQDGAATSTASFEINVIAADLAVPPMHYTMLQGRTLDADAVHGVLSSVTTSGATTSASIVSGPAHGALTLNNDGSFVYVPETGFVGQDSFTYQVTAGVETANATAFITVANNAPEALIDTYVVVPGQMLVVLPARGVLSHARDRNSDALEVVLVDGPAFGALDLEADGSFTYTPNASYPGTDSFTYKLFDGVAYSNMQTVWLEAPPAPVARTEVLSVIHDKALLVARGQGLLANDVILDGRPVTASLVSGPSHGTLVLAPDGSISYRPDANYVGTDTFVYAADDGLASHQVQVTIQVTNAAPVIGDITYTPHFGQPFAVAAGQGILAHVTDADSDLLTVTADAPAHGTLAMNSDGSFLYVPTAGYVGADSFVVHVSDGVTTVEKVVQIDVKDVAPTGADKTSDAKHDRPLVVTPESGLLAGVSDADGDPFSIVNVTQPAFGVVTIYANGSFTYVPAAGSYGIDNFTYQLTDGGLLSSEIHVAINVKETAPTVTPKNNSVLHDTDLFVSAATGLLAEATDTESDPITPTLVTAPSFGSLTLFANGSFRYTPAPGFVGMDGFYFQLYDGLRYSDPIAATLQVTDQAPATQGVYYTAKHSQSFIVGSDRGILSFFKDDDGDPMTVSLVTGPSHGTLQLQATGTFVYTPDAGYYGYDTFAVNVSDGGLTTTAWVGITVAEIAPAGPARSYIVPHDTPLAVGVFDDAPPTFQDNDGRLPESDDGMVGEFLGGENSGGSAPAIPSKSNDAGVVVIGDPSNQSMPGLGTRTTSVILPLQQNLLAQVTDADEDPLTVIAVSQPANGSVQWNSIGSFVYVPVATFAGIDEFTYTVSDGVTTTVFPVSIQVTNSAPSAQNQSFSVPRNGLLSVVDPAKGVLNDATNPDGDKLNAVLVQGPAQGSLTLNADGTFLYRPNVGFGGTDSFTFQAYDGSFYSTTKTITLTVNNGAPVANAASYSMSPFTSSEPAFFSNPDNPLPIPNPLPVSPGASLVVNTGTVPVSGSDPTLGTQTLTLGLLVNATDPNGDSLQLATVNGQSITGPTTFILTTLVTSTNPTGIATTLTVNADGTFTFSVPAGVLPFNTTQISAYFTSDVKVTFQYQVSDGTNLSQPAEATITIYAEWMTAAGNRIGEETAEEKAILKAQEKAQKNTEIRQQAIDQFQSRSTYLSTVASAATPYQDAVTPAQRLFWQQILDATGSAANNQVSFLTDLTTATSQSDVAYALAVHAAEASQSQVDQAAAVAFQTAQSQARANYQVAVATSDGALKATMDAAIAQHDLAVALLEDGLQAAQANAWATMQTLMGQLDATYRTALADAAFNRDQSLAALRGSLASAQNQVIDGLDGAVAQALTTYGSVMASAAQTRDNAVQQAWNTYLQAVTQAYADYEQAGLDQNSTTPLDLSVNAVYLDFVEAAQSGYWSAVSAANLAFNLTITQARQNRDNAIASATAAQNAAALGAANGYWADYQAVMSAYDQAAQTAQGAYDTAVSSAQNTFKQSVALAVATTSQSLQAANLAYDQAVQLANETYHQALVDARAVYDQANANAQDDYEAALAPADQQRLAALAQAQAQADTAQGAANVVFDQAMTQIGIAQIASVQQVEDQAKTQIYNAWLALDTAVWGAFETREQALANLRDANATTVAGIQAAYRSATQSIPSVAKILTQERFVLYTDYLNAAPALIAAIQAERWAASELQIAQTALNVAQAALDTAIATRDAAQFARDVAWNYYESLSETDLGKAAAYAAYVAAQAALDAAQAAIPPLEDARDAALDVRDQKQAAADVAAYDLLVAKRDYRILLDIANHEFAIRMRNGVVGAEEARAAAEKARSISLHSNQAGLAESGNALNATFVSAMADAVRDYGIAQGANSAALQLGMLQSSGTQSVLVAQAQANYDKARAQIGFDQLAGAIDANHAWKIAEKDAAHALALATADAEETFGQTLNNAYSDQQLAVVAAQLPWTLATNAAIEQLTSSVRTAGKVYTLAVGLAQNDWMTAITQAQGQVRTGLTVAQNNYSADLTHTIVDWQNDVMAAEVGLVDAFVLASIARTQAETVSWRIAQIDTAYGQWYVTAGWDASEDTNWSAYQEEVASAWYNFVLAAAPADEAMRRDITLAGNNFFDAYAHAVQTAVAQFGANILGATANANAIWNSNAGADNTAENALTNGQNAASQAYLVEAANLDVSFANAVALEDSALAMTEAVANNTWAAEEKIAATAQQSAIKSAYHTLAITFADSALDFSVAEANEGRTRDDAQNAARLIYDDGVADILVDQQITQWDAMAAYAPVQTGAANDWADAVKQAAAYLKRGLNDAEAEAVERVARIVAEHEILAKYLDMNGAVETTKIRQDGTVIKWARKLAEDLAKPLSKFAIVQLQRPTEVERQMRADANSSRPTDISSNIERDLNTLTGGASRAVLLSEEFTDALNAIDGFFAGMADTFTFGGSTKLRELLWGETATRNHEGGWFVLGQITAQILITIASFSADPCAMSTFGRLAFRAYEAAGMISNGFNAVQDIMAGNYLSAGLNVLGMFGNLTALSRACFTGDMEVKTRRGWVRWDALTEHDEVLSCDEHDPHGELSYKPIELLLRTEASILHVHVKGQVIRTTSEHPFYVWSKGWVAARELQVGDLLRSDDGRFVSVEDVFDTGVVEAVYNCAVAEYHTYFVGQETWGFSVWAHNKCKALGTAAKTRKANMAKGIPASKLGPSGKPKIHRIDHPTRKQAKEAARNQGKRKPIMHPHDEGQPPHYHATDRAGNKIGRQSPHNNFPRSQL